MGHVAVAIALSGVLAAPVAGLSDEGARPGLRIYAGPWGRIEAGFVPQAAHAVVGEPVFFDFVVRNVGSSTIAFTMGGDDRGSPRHNRFTVVVRPVGPPGTQEPLTDPHGYTHGGGQVSPVALGPGQEFRQSLLLQNWARLDIPPHLLSDSQAAPPGSPGTGPGALLAVTASYTLGIRPNGSSETAPTPVHVADGFMLRLSPADEESMAAVVRRFSAQCDSQEEARRRNAWTALGMIRRPDAVDDLLAALAQADTDKRTDDAPGILHALNRHDEDKRVLPAIIAVARDGNHVGQPTACWLLTRIDSPESRQTLLDLAQTSRPEVQREAIFGLGQLKERRALPILRALLSKTGEHDLLRGRIAWAMCRIGEKLDRDWVMGVIQRWPDFADDDGGTVRLVAEHGDLNDARALARCLRDDTSAKISGYNKSLIDAIVKLGGPDYPYRCLDGKLREAPALQAANRRTVEGYRTWAKP
ncbi:MAG TPA: HEAT repeat domain-containing protein [Phycisphaerae bacterium]|nr:HEAT repeat domain-containing protein [Phycisphaerae bacterium]